MRSDNQEGVIVVEGLDGPVTADDFDEAIAAGIRRRKYLDEDVDKRKARGQAYTLATAELRYHHLAQYAIKVMSDELRGNDTPLSLLQEAKAELEAMLQEMPTYRESEELLVLVERMRAVIRRLT